MSPSWVTMPRRPASMPSTNWTLTKPRSRSSTNRPRDQPAHDSDPNARTVIATPQLPWCCRNRFRLLFLRALPFW